MRKFLVVASAAVAAGVLLHRLMQGGGLRLPGPLSGTRALESTPLDLDAPVRTDGDVLGLLQVFDQHQIRCARLALERGLDDATTVLAERLRKEHEDHLGEVEARIEEREPEPRQRGAVSEFQSRCDARFEELEARDGDGFASQYLEAITEEHASMLRLIERSIADAASTTVTTGLLARTRKHLANHLAELEMAS